MDNNYNNNPADEKSDIIATDNDTSNQRSDDDGICILLPEAEQSIEPKDFEENANTPKVEISEENRQYVDKIIQKWETLNFYIPEKAEILLIINQYNDLCSQIKRINNEYSVLFEEVLLANKEYDNLKRNFAQIIEEEQWGDKLFFAMPVINDLDSHSQWERMWCKVVKQSVEESSPRLYINKNLYSCIFTLPKDVYFYKVKEEKLSKVKEDVVKATYLLASKMVLMFKNMKDLSEPLRHILIKLVDNKPLIPENIILPIEEELSRNLSFLRSIVDNSEEKLEQVSVISRSYSNFHLHKDLLSGDYDKFISYARDLYQDVQSRQDELLSFKKVVYNKSMTDLFKLYDLVKKCLNDYLALMCSFEESEAESTIYCNNISDMLKKLLAEIERYLKDTLGVVPLTIEVNHNFNEYPVEYYEVIVAEDAPDENLKECVSLVMDTGFAKYDENNELLFVAKPARISVYNNTVIPII